VEDVAIDGWAFDDPEEARENPQTTAWSYVDKTLFRCRKCRFEWQVGGQNRPYEASGHTGPAPEAIVAARPTSTSTVNPAASRLSEALVGFTGPASLANEEALGAVPDVTGVHVVWDPAGRLLFTGQSAQTRSRLRMHLTGDREASILHDKVGRRLDRELGRRADRDEIRAWLQRCTFAYRLTDSPSTLKAQIMDELNPELNEVRPRD
jgi:hypothetical protein